MLQDDYDPADAMALANCQYSDLTDHTTAIVDLGIQVFSNVWDCSTDLTRKLGFGRW